MKKILSKFKKYSFWVAFTGVVVIFTKNLAGLIGFDVDTSLVENLIMSLCGVFVVLGLVVKDMQENNKDDVKTDDNDIQLLNDEKQTDIEDKNQDDDT